MHLAFVRHVLCFGAALAAFAGTVRAEAAAEFEKILASYAAALDGNDVEALVGLYSRDGVFMGEGAKAVVGHEALRAAYKAIFSTLKLGLGFSLQDAGQSGDLGWARALSSGTVKVLSTDAETQQSFNLLVVFGREGGAWKIRSYLYASDRTAPGEAPR